jgi:tRNA (adenine-N(1)-)-methyltransferase non-catalytic subunit
MILGQGRLITICDSDSPPAYPVLPYMNFDSKILDVLASLNWATAEEDYESSENIYFIFPWGFV